MDIVLINYHAAQLKAKDIYIAINIKNNFERDLSEINFEDNNGVYPQHWLTDKKFSTKRFKNILIISANRNVFLKLACDTNQLMGMEDDERYNFDYHLHEDFIGTATDNGFNFLYYHSKQNL